MGPILYNTTVLSNGVDGRHSSYRRVTASRQSKPYDRAAAYQRTQGFTVAASKFGNTSSFGGIANMASTKGPWQLAWGPDVDNSLLTYRNAANNAAYEAFRDAVKDTAEMAVNIAERQSSLDMIERRAWQLIRFTRALLKFDFPSAAKALSVPKSFRPKARTKDLGALWLEYHFGWSPLIQDIGNAIDILQSPIAARAVRARGKRQVVDITYRRSEPTLLQTARIKGSVRTTCSATVSVTNPNLYRANALGLINPGSVAWELVPFSFVVDWFVPVSTFLNSFTDWVGLDLSDACYFTVIDTPSWTSSYRTRPSFPTNGPWTGGWDITSIGVDARRILGVPSVTLEPRRWSGLSPTRAATSVSLLLQLL